MKTKHSGRENVQRYMLKTYLVMACISVFLGIILCAFMMGRAGHSAKNTMTAELDKIQLSMDHVWQELDELTAKLKKEEQVKNMLDAIARFGAPDRKSQEVYTLREVFKEKLDLCSEATEIYLVDQELKVIIDSEDMFREGACATALKALGIDSAVFAWADDSDVPLFYASYTGSKDLRSFLISPVHLGSGERQGGYVILEVDNDALMEAMALLETADGKACYLEAGGLGYIGTDAAAMEMVDGQILNQPVLSGRFSYDQESYIFARRPSDYFGLEYCYIVPASIYYSEVWIVAIFTAVSVVVLTGASVVLAWWFSKKNTEPLRRIWAALGDNPECSGGISYGRILQDVSELKKRVHQYEKSQEAMELFRILLGQEKDAGKLCAYEERYKDIISDGFFVLQIRVQNINELSDANVLVFCVMNVFSELLAGHCLLPPVEGWDRAYFLVSGEKTVLEEILEQGCSFMDEKLSIAVACGVSEKLFSFADVCNARSHGDYMIEYVELTPELRRQMWYEDVSGDFKDGGEATDGFQNDSLSFRGNLNKFIHQILREDYAGSRELMALIWQKQIFRPDIGPDCARSRMITLTSIVSIPYKEHFGVRSFGGPKRQLSQMYAFTDELLAQLETASEPEDSGQGTFEQMQKYIREHAKDPALTAGSVSEAFHLTASYASGLFKKYSGEGLLDAIHRERIRLAKKLLKSGATVSEAARQSGYLDARGFIRNFKKYEGITPGQYKNIS